MNPILHSSVHYKSPRGLLFNMNFNYVRIVSDVRTYGGYLPIFGDNKFSHIFVHVSKTACRGVVVTSRDVPSARRYISHVYS